MQEVKGKVKKEEIGLDLEEVDQMAQEYKNN